MYRLTAYKKLGHRFKKRYVVSNIVRVFFFHLKHRRKKKQPKIQRRTLLLVRIDLIGDYVLFRNFLTAIRNSEFKNFHITLCGNVVYKDLAENIDRRFIDKFVWIDRPRFLKDKAYYYTVLQQINDAGFDVAFQPAYSREIYGDLLINASQARRRVGVNGDLANQTIEQRQLTDAFYTQLVEPESTPKFEFFRNKEIVEKFAGRDSKIVRPALTLPEDESISIQQGDYAVLVAGASHIRKQWPHFDKVVDCIVNRHSLKIVFVGHGKSDRKAVDAVIEKISPHEFVDLCNKTNLMELSRVIDRAKLVVSNDTAAVHIAASVDTPTVCITKGAHAFRFNNYPRELGINICFVFPTAIEAFVQNGNFQNYQSQYNDQVEISSISYDRVVRAIDEVMTVAS